MRRFIDEYDRVFVDIDDTLIYGWYVQLMHHTWNIFRNDLLSQLLMKIQDKFNFYKVNRKLVHALKKPCGLHAWNKVIFLTVRAESEATKRMVNRIMTDCKSLILYNVVALGTDNGHIDKAQYIYENYGDKKCILIDDSKLNRDMAEQYGIDTFDPKLLRERLIG